MSACRSPAGNTPRYVIINDCDAPQPDMVCQWVEGKGYCYLDRRCGKPKHDGMGGAEATPVEEFGIVWADNADGTVSFYFTEREPTARYRDGTSRCWQGKLEAFEYRRLRRRGSTTSGKNNSQEKPHG